MKKEQAVKIARDICGAFSFYGEDVWQKLAKALPHLVGLCGEGGTFFRDKKTNELVFVVVSSCFEGPDGKMKGKREVFTEFFLNKARKWAVDQLVEIKPTKSLDGSTTYIEGPYGVVTQNEKATEEEVFFYMLKHVDRVWGKRLSEGEMRTLLDEVKVCAKFKTIEHLTPAMAEAICRVVNGQIKG